MNEEAILEWLIHNRSTGDEEDVIEDIAAESLEAMVNSVENLAVLFCKNARKEWKGLVGANIATFLFLHKITLRLASRTRCWRVWRRSTTTATPKAFTSSRSRMSTRASPTGSRSCPSSSSSRTSCQTSLMVILSLSTHFLSPTQGKEKYFH